MAGSKELAKLGPLVVIDTLVKTYPAYKHDDIFNLKLGLVYQLMTISKRRDYITVTAGAMRRKSIKKELPLAMIKFIIGFAAGFIFALLWGSVYAYYKGYAEYRKRIRGNSGGT